MDQPVQLFVAFGINVIQVVPLSDLPTGLVQVYRFRHFHCEESTSRKPMLLITTSCTTVVGLASFQCKKEVKTVSRNGQVMVLDGFLKPAALSHDVGLHGIVPHICLRLQSRGRRCCGKARASARDESLTLEERDYGFATQLFDDCLPLVRGGDNNLQVKEKMEVDESASMCNAFSSSSESCTGEEEMVVTTSSPAPLVAALKQCADMNAAAFHFPGHRRGAGASQLLTDLIGVAPFQHDLPELPELDNLYAAKDVIAEAQRMAASLFGADCTWFLVNGSTCGIQAAVMATCKPGDYLILPRNCHMSAVSAMVLSGAVPKYVIPILDSRWGVAHGVEAAQVDAAICEVERGGGNVGAVLVVSPTYFGVCSMVEAIADVCHNHGVPLLVDEAHGAHFQFQANLPRTALEQGADIAVQSTHKVLGSLTQSAMLHSQGTCVSRQQLTRCLQMLQTSSPSYLLLSSLDAARAQMSEVTCTAGLGTSIMDAAVSLASSAKNALCKIPGLLVLDKSTIDEKAAAEVALAGIDPLRITVGLWELGLTGFDADDILRLEYGVVAELPSLLSLTFVVSAGTSSQDIIRLIGSLEALSARYRTDAPAPLSALLGENASSDEPKISNPRVLFHGNGWENGTAFWQQVRVLSPREAFYADFETVGIEDAVGRVCTELLCPYPPGIPVIVPGEVITQEALDYVRAVLQGGGIVTGASDTSFASINVVV